MVVFRLAFGETVVFADSTPDLVRLLHELLPLVTPAPSGPIYMGFTNGAPRQEGRMTNETEIRSKFGRRLGPGFLRCG
jgi:hypothetical protein